MSRILNYIGYIWPDYYGNSGTNNQEYFSDFRNRFRNGFDPGETHANCMISDIVRWQRSGNYYGYAFIMKAMSGGVPTGPVWLFTCMGGENGTTPVDWPFYWYRGTDGIDNYYESFSDNSLYEYVDTRFSMFYHPTAGLGYVSVSGTGSGSPGIGTVAVDNTIIPTKEGIIVDVQDGGDTWIIKTTKGEAFYETDTIYADGQTLVGSSMDYSHCFNFGFTDHDNGLLGGTIAAPVHQDFTTAPYNPVTSLATFQKFMIWPYNDMIKGVANVTAWNQPHVVAVYDTDKPFLAVYGSYDRSPSIYSAVHMGEIVTPYATEDTYRSAAMWQNFDSADVDSPGEVLRFRLWVRNPAGTGRGTCDRYRQNFLGYDNSPRNSDWTYPWHPVPVGNSSYYKGELDTDLFRIIGPTTQKSYMLFDGPEGPFIKYGQYIAHPWVTGEPIFPPFQWAKAYPWND